jgi:hypothetical protein
MRSSFAMTKKSHLQTRVRKLAKIEKKKREN